MKEIILTDKAPAPIGPYSQGIAVGGLIFFSGQIAIDPAVGKITATDIVPSSMGRPVKGSSRCEYRLPPYS